MRHDTAPHTRALLPLIEQLIMVLVFMVAAAVCMRAFVHAANVSRQNAERDQALVHAQELAELLKHAGSAGEDPFPSAGAALGGQADEETIRVSFDDNWTITAGEVRYQMGADRTEGSVPGLDSARIWVMDTAEERELIRFTVAWQGEVTVHA